MPAIPQQEYLPKPLDPRPWWRSVLMFTLVWVPAALFAIGIISCAAGLFVALLGIVLGPALALFAIFAIYRNLIVWRERRAMAVLGYVENAVRLNMPLDRFLAAAERSERGALRRTLARIRALLAMGASIGQAVETGASEVPPRVARALIASEKIGSLQPTLTRLMRRQHRSRPTYAEDNVPFYRFYIAGVGLTLLLIGSFMMIFVVPKFREIFKDFRINLPPVTKHVIDFADFTVNSTPIAAIVGALLVLALIFFIARLLQGIFMPNLPRLFPLPAREWVAWHTPWWRELQRDQALADVFEYLGNAMQAGLPMPEALVAAETLPMNRHMRVHLRRWREVMLAGAPPAQAAQQAGLPALLVGFLKAGDPGRGYAIGSQEMYTFLARYYREKFSRLLVAIRSVSEPIMVLCMGALVGFFIYAMFLPLTMLILSQAVGPNAGAAAVSGNGVL